MRLDNRTCDDNADEALLGLEQAAAVTCGYVVKSRPFRNSCPSFLENRGSWPLSNSSIQLPLHFDDK